MGFYFEEEHSQEMYIGLKGLVNNNNGFFKSKKQAEFYVGQRILEPQYRFTYRGITTERNEDYVIIASAKLNFDNSKSGMHKGLISIDYIFTFDEFGVTELHQVNMALNKDRHGLHITKTEKLFSRDTSLDLPEFVEESKKSEYIGEVSEKMELAVKVDFVTCFDNQWGTTFVYKFIDENDNILVWLTSSYKDWEKGDEMEIKFKIKAHDEYKGQKQTKISYVKEI